MGLLSRLFGKKQAAAPVTPRPVVGHETSQTMDEQAATRGRMEAELDAQRERRSSPPQ